MKRNLLYIVALIIVASSCNKDDVIKADTEDFYRAKTANSLAECVKVFEYTPAPGQFINETKTGGFTGAETTPELACNYAYGRMKDGLYVSLGGFGGYIVVGLDHSVDNVSGYDIAVKGNSFKGSSEPGVVWVMQDKNGDGLPNDTWYELAGSEYGKTETIQNYSVTYFKPQQEHKPVQWKDNLGNEGQIDYLGMYHSQAYYYPAWVSGPSYTLTGTCLKARNYDSSGNGSYWVQGEYDWGYADNYSTIDSYDGELSKLRGANLFDISNAVDSNGTKVNLTFVDFIKVQGACNTKSGSLGENSVEVLGVYDYLMVN